MIEVFMLGVLITIVKMVSLARVIPDAALFAFAALDLPEPDVDARRGWLPSLVWVIPLIDAVWSV